MKKLINDYNIELTMIGEVSSREHVRNYNFLNNYIKNNNLRKYCRIKTNIKFQDMPKEYTECTLFVLPSHAEPAAISILEAQGYGRPVICSDTCGSKVYLNKSCSQIFKSKNLDSLIKSIKFFLDRKSVYSNFVIKSHRNALKNFSKKKFEENFLNFLKLNF